MLVVDVVGADFKKQDFGVSDEEKFNSIRSCYGKCPRFFFFAVQFVGIKARIKRVFSK